MQYVLLIFVLWKMTNGMSYLYWRDVSTAMLRSDIHSKTPIAYAIPLGNELRLYEKSEEWSQQPPALYYCRNLELDTCVYC